MNCRNLDSIAADGSETRTPGTEASSGVRCQVSACSVQQGYLGYLHTLVFLSDKSEKGYQLGNLVFLSTL